MYRMSLYQGDQALKKIHPCACSLSTNFRISLPMSVLNPIRILIEIVLSIQVTLGESISLE